MTLARRVKQIADQSGNATYRIELMSVIQNWPDAFGFNEGPLHKISA
jgi:hypothetical protein